MYEQLNLNLSPLAASAFFGVAIGILFGVFAQSSRFCFRRALVESNSAERHNARAVWILAFAVAILGTQLAVFLDVIDFAQHRFHASGLSVASLIIGGLLFGIGMVLTRGCASRLTVLAGTGNLRAVFVLLVFAITAHATLKGALSPLRTSLAAHSIDADITNTLSQSPLATTFLLLVVVLTTAGVLLRSKLGVWQIVCAIGIGLLVPVAWLGTGWVLQDEFDPIAFQSLSFTSASADWLFWSVASTSIGAGFGVGLLSGVVLGSTLSALARKEFLWVSFESAVQTRRYIAGGALMGMGGVLAGGCTVGAGLSGVSTLSISAMVALCSIVVGALATQQLLKYTPVGSARTPALSCG